MKKIFRESILEESKYYCDKHKDRECFSELKLSSWYGSEYDLMGMEIHLCDECLKEMYNLIKEKFNKEPEEIIL